MIWRLAQALTLCAGMFTWGALIVAPELGLHLLWNVLIPVAPALFVVAPGVWRNLCPLGILALLPNHLGISRGRTLPPIWRGRLFFGAFVLLMLVVPLRKVVLDTNGPVLAAVLAAVGILAIGMGSVFTWKSGWCSSLCPVYPVELLYGTQPLVTAPNVHCSSCLYCVSPCSESTAGLTPITAVDTGLGKRVGITLTGCFPGFVWGWYNVPTYSGWEGFANIHVAYGIPFGSAAVTLALFLILRKMWPRRARLIGSIFAAAAISAYYWFRLPTMFGIGAPDAAMIADISPMLPAWSAAALRVLALIGFGWLIVGRSSAPRPWEDSAEY